MLFRFDVAFSFAGPHREKVRAIAELVRNELGDGKVFFDEWFEHEILGSDMDVLLQRIYHDQSLMVVADLSEDYASREWTQAEARAVRALRKKIDTARDETARLRLLNARFGAGDVPGILSTEGWLDAVNKTPQQCADVILKRLALLKKRLAGSGTSGKSKTDEEDKMAPAVPAPPIPILFFHPATNDEFYSRRERELAWLDDCAKNPGIRLATVTGVGGLGKTSLVGHWLQVHQGWQHRAFRGVFFFSFYSDRKSESFFDAFLQFVCEVQNLPGIPKDQPYHLAASAVRRWNYLVVLDGLEVLQQNEDDPHYGWIADPHLNEFVARAGENGSSLLVLTSRFTFPQITREHSDHARAMELPLFDAREGADLLTKCGLTNETRENLEAYSTQFGGHPLALRLFAGACKASPWTDPAQASRTLLHDHSADALPDPNETGISAEEVQRRKQRRQFYKLLTWFQQKLPAAKRRLIQIVALFKEPVATATVTALARGLDAMRADFGGCDVAHILYLLEQLKDEHLLQREDDGATQTISWAAHPIVRDVFRETALKEGDSVAAQFAEIVAGKGDGSKPGTVADLHPVMEAIEVLLAAGDFEAADKLYRARLANGRVFRSIPAPQEGVRCARGFLEPQERRQALEKSLGRGRSAFFLNEAALYANILGEMTGVEQGYQESNAFDYALKSWKDVSVGFQNLSEVHALLGSLEESVASACEALFYAGVDEEGASGNTGSKKILPGPEGPGTGPPRPLVGSLARGRCAGRFPKRPTPVPANDVAREKDSRAYHAEACSLAGDLRSASQDFVRADAIARAEDDDHDSLYSLSGIQWCRHRRRLGETDIARPLTIANHGLCWRNRWNSDLARCDLLLGELDLAEGALEFAFGLITGALHIFREARQGRDIPDALLAMAQARRALALSGKSPGHPGVGGISETASPEGLRAGESALADCEEALRRAQHSGFLLKQCDALNFRSVLRREAGEHRLAIQDARDALEIAERCGYYWGRHEALRQLRDSCQAAGKTADAAAWDEAERELTRRMAPEIAAALEINRRHDKEMERLYGKKGIKRSKWPGGP
jgi:tetratricopeptide (TPR) repeat protein